MVLTFLLIFLWYCLDVSLVAFSPAICAWFVRCECSVRSFMINVILEPVSQQQMSDRPVQSPACFINHICPRKLCGKLVYSLHGWIYTILPNVLWHYSREFIWFGSELDLRLSLSIRCEHSFSLVRGCHLDPLNSPHYGNICLEKRRCESHL